MNSAIEMLKFEINQIERDAALSVAEAKERANARRRDARKQLKAVKAAAMDRFMARFEADVMRIMATINDQERHGLRHYLRVLARPSLAV